MIVGGLCVFAGIFFFATDKREAFALVRVKRGLPGFLPDGQPNEAETDRKYEEYRRTQMVLAKSREVLAQALADPKVVKVVRHLSRQDAIIWLEKNVRTGVMNSEIIRISFAGGEPEQRIAIVNAVAKAYLKVVLERENRMAEFEIKVLETNVSRLRQLLKTKRDEHRLLRDQQGLDLRRMDRELLRDQLATVQRERLQVQLGQAAARVKLSRLREKEKGAGKKDPGAARLEEEIAVMAEQEKLLAGHQEELKQKVQAPEEESPKLEEIEEQIARTQRVLRRAQDRLEVLKINQQAPPRITLFQPAQSIR
jgi:hypothetical protein